MLEKGLMTIINFYYPSNIDSIVEKDYYVLTKEHQNLVNKIFVNKSNYPEKINDIQRELMKHRDDFRFNDLTNFQWQDRCYTFQFTKKVDNQHFHLNVYISILAPYFVFQYFKTQIIENDHKLIIINKNEFSNDNFISKINGILNKYDFSLLNENLLKTKISNINFDDIKMGQFTYYNAFFNSQTLNL